MLLGFSSLGKPEASLAATKVLALHHGFDFVELRALGGTVDLPAYFQSKEKEDAGPPCPVRILGTSLCLVDADRKDLPKFMETAQLAERLGAPYLRVFGGGRWKEETSAAAYENAVRAVGDIRQELQKQGLKTRLLLETHDAFSSSEMCLTLNQKLEEPLEILWDSHHTWRMAGESPAESWAQLGPLVRHVHYKDSIGTAQSYEYVLPRKGEFPTKDLLDLLAQQGFNEGFSLEWEKLWHPKLANLEEALDAFARVVKTR